MDKVTKFFDKLSKILLYAAMIVLMVVIVLVIINIIGRSFFNFTIGGIVEIVQYGVFTSVTLGLARTCFNGSHVIVTVILEKMPDKARGIVALIELIIAAVAFFMTAYVCAILMPEAMASQLVTEVYKIPYYVIYLILVIGMAMSGIIFLYKGFVELKKGFTGGFEKVEN